MLRRVFVAGLVLLASAAPARARPPRDPSITATDAPSMRVALGTGGGSSVGSDSVATTPEYVGVLGAGLYVFRNRLTLGVDLRWFTGERQFSVAPMHYRAFRATADVGFEIGAHHVRFRPYVGVGTNLYRLVLDDFRSARAYPVVAPGLALTFGGARGFFAGLDLRFAQIIHSWSRNTLAPTQGPLDSSVNVFVLLGWSFERCAPRGE